VRPAQRHESERPDPTATRRAVAERSRPERERVADLFGSQAEAGGEDDPSLGRADSSPPDASGARLTGQRNETSVLFSLDALIKAEAAPESKRSASPPRQELSRQRETEMLLGGSGPSSIAGLGGDFNSLVAPDLMAPARAVVEPLPRAAYGDDYIPPPPAKGNALKLVLLVVATAGIAVAVTMFAPKFLAKPAAPEPAATKAAESPKPAPTEPVATTPEAMPSTSASAAAPPATGVGATPRPESRPAPGSRGQAAPKPAEASPAEVPEKGLAEAMGEGTSAPPFDQGAAKTALVAAASGAASCKQEGGPTGTGRALVTFASSGRVTKAEITGDFAGTTVGGCVARVFRGARVPKFSGEPTTVSKNFTIQ
jgi:hypothetical protein